MAKFLHSYGNGDQQVAGRAAVLSGVALTPDGDGLAVVDTGWDAGLDGFALAYRACAVAVLAGLVDDLALAAALGTGGAGGEHAHGGLSPYLDLTAAVAVRADLRRGAGGAAVAVAGAALLHTIHGNFFFAAESRFLKTDGQGHADALPPLGRVGVGPPSAAETASEKAAENVAQVSEVEVPVKPGPAGAKVGVHARVAVLVVPGLLVSVGQHLVSLVDLLELLLGLFIAGVQVGVVLPGHLFISKH